MVAVFETVVRFTMNMDIANVTIDLMNNIRNEVSTQMNIDISRVGQLQISQSQPPRRRLMSTQVSYTITSNSLAESNAVESSTSIETLNSILSRASNKTLSASDVEIETKMITPTPTPPDVPVVESVEAGANITIIIAAVCVGVFVLIAVVVCFIVFRKRLPNKNLNVDGGNYNIVDAQEYCPVCSYRTHHGYIMRHT